MIKQYIVDAFTDKIFHGNPAAICVLDKWPTEKTMINMARENNLSETAFTVREGSRYHLRWFTPAGEIDLCGHATLACFRPKAAHSPSENRTTFTKWIFRHTT